MNKIKLHLTAFFGLLLSGTYSSAQLSISEVSDITTADAAARLLQPVSSLSFQYTYSPILNWTATKSAVKDFTITSGKTMWVINTAGEVSFFTNNTWTKTTMRNAIVIAADRNNVAWVLTGNGQIFRNSAGKINGWQNVMGLASDISIGEDGSVWIITPTGEIKKWTGLTWQAIPGQAIRVAVDKTGMPWVVNVAGETFKYNGSGFNRLPTTAAKDIAITGDSVWILGIDGTVSRWANNKQSTAGGRDFKKIISDHTGTPWVINANNILVQGSWQPIIDESEGISFYVPPTTLPSKTVTLTQGGGYAAWMTLTYKVDGTLVTAIDQKGLNLGWKKSFTIPGNATSFSLVIKEATGLAWEPWKQVYVQVLPTPKDLCVKVYGTTLDPKWNNDCK